MPHLPRGTSQTSQTSVSVSDTNYGSWLTKQQAADAIGVTTKTIERLAAEGKVQQARWRRDGRGPELAVYQPDDVARIAAERRTAPSAFVLPVGVPPPSNGHGPASAVGLALSAQPPVPGDDILRRVFAAAIKAVSETSETPVALFVSIAEAAQVSGLSRTYLRRLIDEAKLPAVRDGRRWRIRRRDLEAL